MNPKLKTVATLTIFIFILTSIAQATVQFSIGISTPEARIRFVYSDYYNVEPDVIYHCEHMGIPVEEVPVVLFLSKKGRVKPEVIIKWRLAGMSWYEITIKLRLKPDIYIVPIPAHINVGPPYGRAYGYWRKHKHLKIKLSDEEIREFIHLRIASEYYKIKPEEVLKRREREPYLRIISGELERHPEKFEKAKMKEHERGYEGKGHKEGKGGKGKIKGGKKKGKWNE